MEVSAAVVAPAASEPTSTAQQCQSSFPSSPHQYPTEVSSTIFEESDESDSEPLNEPVTPVSGRQSQEFHTRQSHDHDITPTAPDNSASPFPSIPPESINTTTKAALVINNPTLPSSATQERQSTSTRPPTPPSRTSGEDQQQPPPFSSQRRSARGSTSSFKRTMTTLFKRSNSQSGGNQPVLVDSNYGPGESTGEPKGHFRRFSLNRSSATTPRSTTPPSPGSPTVETKEPPASSSVPNSDDFLKRKNRASTGLSLRSRAVNFAIGNGRKDDVKKARPQRRRASSFDNSKARLPHHDQQTGITSGRQVIYMAADAGVGVKARRLSLSLPDDYAVDVVELTSEFEYQHKFLGRHRDQLGKGATARVRVMARKGCPGELYAVKEFRGKSSSETKEEYEKKVKSEFSIAKSLHHPNLIETIRLCTDHGRWNHVMEYCSEGDLFSLVQKGYLKREDRYNDRLCLFKQLVQGLNYLHSNGIAHRDIKLENLLITKDSKLKITDFGVSEVFSGIHPGLREAGGECGKNMGEVRLCAPGVCGSEPYIAPEVLAKDRHYDPRALDVWGAAIVMINLLCGSGLWEKARVGAGNSALYSDMVRAWDKWNVKHPDGQCTMTESDYPSFVIFDRFVNPPALRRVLLQMLNPDPDRRATIDTIIKNRWVKNIECCQLESYDDPVKFIDATKKSCLKSNGTKKIFCHNHLPPQNHGTHSLGKMPGQVGY